LLRHNAHYKYDCNRCKHNWNCGYTSDCVLHFAPDPPLNIKLKVEQARNEANLPGQVFEHVHYEVIIAKICKRLGRKYNYAHTSADGALTGYRVLALDLIFIIYDDRVYVVQNGAGRDFPWASRFLNYVKDENDEWQLPRHPPEKDVQQASSR
jgi:hypothetical protein